MRQISTLGVVRDHQAPSGKGGSLITRLHATSHVPFLHEELPAALGCFRKGWATTPPESDSQAGLKKPTAGFRKGIYPDGVSLSEICVPSNAPLPSRNRLCGGEWRDQWVQRLRVVPGLSSCLLGCCCPFCPHSPTWTGVRVGRKPGQ